MLSKNIFKFVRSAPNSFLKDFVHNNRDAHIKNWGAAALFRIHGKFKIHEGFDEILVVLSWKPSVRSDGEGLETELACSLSLSLSLFRSEPCQLAVHMAVLAVQPICHNPVSLLCPWLSWLSSHKPVNWWAIKLSGNVIILSACCAYGCPGCTAISLSAGKLQNSLSMS